MRDLLKPTSGCDYPVDLAKFNADGSRMLPLPATYVIDRDGKIVYAFVETDYTKRAEPSDILAALRALKGS
jgi:peroxiredoxin